MSTSEKGQKTRVEVLLKKRPKGPKIPQTVSCDIEAHFSWRQKRWLTFRGVQSLSDTATYAIVSRTLMDIERLFSVQQYFFTDRPNIFEQTVEKLTFVQYNRSYFLSKLPYIFEQTVEKLIFVQYNRSFF